ncbi:MAG: hypothetical protein CMJ16_07580 [Peredibacter sp.]|nr:hypothetical protein [Peredibacter sp.]
MKRIILHVGRHKSGTTSLQASFWENRNLFLSKGILYPESSRRENAHHLFAEALHPKRVRENGLANVENEDVIRNLINEIESSSCQTVLISSEAFQNCTPTDVKHIFRNYDVSIIFYIREQVGYLESAYLQEVQATNYHESIERFEEERFFVDYYKFYKSWEKEFNNGNVIVRAFEKSKLKNGDIVDDFFETVIFPLTDGEFQYKKPQYDGFLRNASLKGIYIPFKLRLNTTIKIHKPCLYQTLGILSDEIDENSTVISEYLKYKVNNDYRESNFNLSEELGLDFNFFFNRSSKVYYHSHSDISPSEFLNLLRQLIARDERCSYLLRELYSYELIDENEHFKFIFSDNLILDSLKFIYLNTAKQQRRLFSELETSDGSFRIKKEKFNPQTDFLSIFFENEKNSVPLRLMNGA